MAKVFTITDGLENMGAMKTGGQGSVYKGKRIGEIITAIKILPTPIFSESAEDKNYTSFQSEVQKLKKVNETPNPNVVKIISSGVTDSGNFPFIEMEFIEGPDLEEFLRPPLDPVFSIKEVLKVTDQLSHALAHCHRVDVKHGDIKSNNIKFNNKSGNYVLLDFGMAIMSDEQRRTSMRHAGAVEFMAPEQNDGLMLFETDVYSFGVVLYELLTGSVPFPIKGMGDTARNKVMIAHMEMPPPDILQKRSEALPASWSQHKKDHEMHVPEWLVSMIYKCLEKKPEHRFANGVELCDYVTRNSIITSSKHEWIDERIELLQQENERLMREKEQLQARIFEYQKLSANNNFPVQETMAQQAETFYELPKSKRTSNVLLLIGLLLALSVLGYLWWNKKDKQDEKVRVAATAIDTNEVESIDPNLKAELIKARAFLRNNQLSEAIKIYDTLSAQQVPEASYELGNLALQDKHQTINCKTAFELISRAAGNGYTPAKRTLGVIYSFADDPSRLEKFNYHTRCNFVKNPVEGSKYLVEAMIAGDSIANKLVDEMKVRLGAPNLVQ